MLTKNIIKNLNNFLKIIYIYIFIFKLIRIKNLKY